MGGGLIERNQAILEGDKLIATVYEVSERRRKRDKKRESKKKKNRDKPKKPAGFMPPPMVRTQIAAFDPQLSYAENELEARAKVQLLQS